MMKNTYRLSLLSFLIIISLIIISCADKNNPSASNQATEDTNVASPDDKMTAYAMVIHGGAGTILRENMTPEMEKAYTDALNEALSIGEGILQQGGSSLDAVVETISYMENIPLFNAGKGAVFAHNGKNMLDASIMQGSDKNAGAIAGVTSVKNPITGAKAVMLKSDHVMLSGIGAETFCMSQNLDIVDNKYFYTDRRYKSLQRQLTKEKSTGMTIQGLKDSKYGTVGAVALDRKGNIVAGTSTGGMTNKRYDRIGDSPIIGAGTYADNNTCGISCTGHGEFFIRYAVAHDVSAMMEYTGASVEVAADKIINEKLVEAKGSGGLIALDHMGNISMPFNTAGMYRGYVTDRDRYVGIYGEE